MSDYVNQGMLRLVFLAALGLSCLCSYAQLKKFYTLKESAQFDTVSFTLEATTGNCFLKSTTEEGPLSIYGNPDLDKINPSFQRKVDKRTCEVSLALQEYKSSSLGDGLLFAMIRDMPEDDNYWKILLDQEKVYRLNLNYGFGSADVDLSGTSVQNFKVRSGSADILVDYDNGEPNKIAMDTFWVKSDMGSVVARHLELTRAKYVMANVGFGRALLDFSKSTNQRCMVDASVGAGNLDIFLPGKEVPMIIYFKDSPLCGRRMADGFEEVENNVFVNMSYKADAENLMTFKVDVALGNVAFHYDD
ncbi:hypothetical protein [Marinoscillum furvescens]|uniref:Uncharacterized protein n=1 Tax=Marinoscillum furvescens DSM 4134 TaxID=1122208 RepID=A0A3D9L584_MARFU|nr:hypothetical protein [Marinoscillum furvescens]RED99789.1 hypothetical protein C7460_10771 [Marinoscillum furvescens DSM 4134]